MGQEKKKTNRRSIRVLLFAFVIMMLAGSAYLAKLAFAELAERRAGASFYEQLAAAAPAMPTRPNPQTVQNEDTEPPMEILPGSQLDFETLRETCPDIVGWLKIEDTVIDYPIVQGEDNDFYLHHLADQSYNASGAVMMDRGNDGSFGDAVTILHAHHMNNGTMFGSLDQYKTRDYYLDHSTIRLYTPGGDYDVAVLAAFTVNGYSFGYPTSFADREEFDTFIRKALSSTGYETDVEPEFGDRLLLLSTCAYSFSGARFVVIGKLLDA